MSICSVPQCCRISETVLEANSTAVPSEPPAALALTHGGLCLSLRRFVVLRVSLRGAQNTGEHAWWACSQNAGSHSVQEAGSPPQPSSPSLSLSGTAAAIEETACEQPTCTSALVHAGKFRHLLSYSSPGLYHIGAISLSDLKAQGMGSERGVFVQLPQLLLFPACKEVLGPWYTSSEIKEQTGTMSLRTKSGQNNIIWSSFWEHFQKSLNH